MLSASQGATRVATVTKPLPSPQAQGNERDQELLRLIAGRDRPAFEELYLGYHRRLSRFLGRLTPRQDLIEEAVNETLWIVWRKAPEFRGSSLVSTWIMGIAYRCALKSLRRYGADAEALPEQLADSAVQLPIEEQERREWIMEGMRHLPPEQRTTLELAYYFGHSGEEIAQIMDCPISTVKARMFHARVKLRNLLPKLGGLKEGQR